MKVIIWGLEYDVLSYTPREIATFILFFAVICFLMGRYVSSENFSNSYFLLIRSNDYARLWRRWWLKILVFSLIIVSGAFFLFKILDFLLRWNLLLHGWQLPYFLWFLGVSLIGMIFMLSQNFRYGQTISFLLVVCVEVFCVYMSGELKQISAVLIGNFVMLNRSNYIVEGGYPLKIIIVILCFFIGCCGLFGYYITFRRGKR